MSYALVTVDPIRKRRIVRLLAEPVSNLAVVPAVSLPDRTTPVTADSLRSSPEAASEGSDWIKPAIANLLNRAIPDESARVQVENVDYGTWIWEEQEQMHVHAPFKMLRSRMGKDEARKFNEFLPVVKATWSDVRVWKNVEV